MSVIFPAFDMFYIERQISHPAAIYNIRQYANTSSAEWDSLGD